MEQCTTTSTDDVPGSPEISPTVIPTEEETCAVVSCDSSEDLFPFPANNAALANKWLELCGRLQESIEDPAKLAICGRHFAEEDFGRNRYEN